MWLLLVHWVLVLATHARDLGVNSNGGCYVWLQRSSFFNTSTPQRETSAKDARLQLLKDRTKANFEKLRELKRKAAEQQPHEETAASEEPVAADTSRNMEASIRSPSGKSFEQRVSVFRRRSLGSEYAQQSKSRVRYVFKWPCGSGPEVYLDIAHDGKSLGRVVCKLYQDKVSEVTEQFRKFCVGGQVRNPSHN